MFGTLRRGQFLVRNLQRCSRRQIFTPLISRSVELRNLSAGVTTRAFHTSPLPQSSSGGASPAETVNRDGPPSLSEDQKKVSTYMELKNQDLVSGKIIEVITKDMGITDMTEIQRETIHQTLQRKDVLAQAKTGTGKTLAFLVPVLQNIIRQQPDLAEYKHRYAHQRRHKTNASAADIRALIISPTRELAEQIAAEAFRVSRRTGIVVQTAVGGTKKQEGLRKIQREGCHLLIGTPGRLIDIFSDPSSGVEAPNLGAFVLDEADRLLDEGFAPDIESLQSYLPKTKDVDRQTLMFSATIARNVINIARRALKPDFAFVKTVRDDEQPTHLAVPQKAVFLHSSANEMPAILEIASEAIRNHQLDPTQHRPFKAIVYYNSTAEVGLANAAYNLLRQNPDNRFSKHPLDITSFEMHSRLTQAQRTLQSNKFRRAESAILFSSDVTARGMDFPDVTHVIQIGVPRDRETYIHRIGRTARAGKTGEGWLLLPASHERDLRRIHDIPLKEDDSLQTATPDFSKPTESHSELVSSIFNWVKAGYQNVQFNLKSKAYTAKLSGLTPIKLRELNEITKTLWQLDKPPSIPSRLARNLQIHKFSGLNIEDDRDSGYGRRGYGDHTRPRRDFSEKKLDRGGRIARKENAGRRALGPRLFEWKP